MEETLIEREETFAKESKVKIYIATDYSEFVLSEFNRNPGHYKKVMESIKENDYTQFQPILVNRKMEIVDGQNRFLACKELGLPIHFIVSQDINIYAAADINQASKNWNAMDYARHYSTRGRESYTRLLDLIHKYDQRISVVQSFGKLSDGVRSHSDSIKKGKFEFKDDIDVDAFFEHMLVFDEFYPFSKREKFVKAMLALYLHEDYEPAKMENKVKYNSGIVKEQPRVDMMTEELLKLYNYKSRKPILLGKKYKR